MNPDSDFAPLYFSTGVASTSIFYTQSQVNAYCSMFDPVIAHMAYHLDLNWESGMPLYSGLLNTNNTNNTNNRAWKLMCNLVVHPVVFIVSTMESLCIEQT